MWVPDDDDDPIVLQEPTRSHTSVFGAVNIATGQFVYQMSDIFNAMTFLDFLKYLVSFQTHSKKIYLILDNSRYHHANLLKPWLNHHKHEIILEFLPPYSPQLNPIERVWKETRRKATHNRYFPDIPSLVEAVQTQFSVWSTPNESLANLCSIN